MLLTRKLGQKLFNIYEKILVYKWDHYVLNLKNFKLRVEAIENYDPHLKVLSYHECRVPLLKTWLQYTN